jgi:hypothetical protein
VVALDKKKILVIKTSISRKTGSKIANYYGGLKMGCRQSLAVFGEFRKKKKKKVFKTIFLSGLYATRSNSSL